MLTEAGLEPLQRGSARPYYRGTSWPVLILFAAAPLFENEAAEPTQIQTELSVLGSAPPPHPPTTVAQQHGVDEAALLASQSGCKPTLFLIGQPGPVIRSTTVLAPCVSCIFVAALGARPCRVGMLCDDNSGEGAISITYLFRKCS